MGKKSLFEDDEPVPAELALNVNEEFAKRFEHNEKRAELHRLKEAYPEKTARLEAQLFGAAAAANKAATSSGIKGEGQNTEDADSSDDEDEDDGYIPPKTEAQLLQTLLKIRARDRSIYAPDAKFYSSGEEGEAEGQPGQRNSAEGNEGSGSQKRVYLKDVLYSQAMEGDGVEGSDSEAEGVGGRGRDDGDDEAGPPTYDQEQRELKQAFLQAFEEGGAEGGGGGEEGEAFGGVLKKKRAQRGREESSDDEDGDAQEAHDDADERVQSLLDAYFGSDEALPEGDRFLKSYILKRGWVEKDSDDGGYDADFAKEDEEDEQYIEQAEQYEARYNFRFEEPGASQIVTYPRQIEGVVRKEDDRRKRKRTEKTERLAEEESRRQQEIKRLKNLKKQEIQDKLSEIQTVAGSAAPDQTVLNRLMAGDFDPEEYDRHMAAAFGDDYYEGAEEGVEDLADAEFEQELANMAGLGDDEGTEGGKGEAAAAGFAALRKKLLEAEAGEGEQGDDGDESEEEEEGAGQQAAKTQEQLAAERAEVQRLLEEYYKLDYEDYVGGVATRFRYKDVPQEDFGLSVTDVLALTDKELNQVVSLRNLAPYREEGGRRTRPNYGALNAIRAQQREAAAPGANKQRKQEWWRQKGGGRGEWKTGVQEEENGLHEQQEGGRGEMEGQKGQGGQLVRQTNHAGQQRDDKQSKREAHSRLESFVKPSLKRARGQGGEGRDGRQQQGTQGGGGSKKKQKLSGRSSGTSQQQHVQSKPQQSAEHQQQDGGPALTRAQKKNLRRAQRRAEKHAKQGDTAAVVS